MVRLGPAARRFCGLCARQMGCFRAGAKLPSWHPQDMLCSAWGDRGHRTGVWANSRRLPIILILEDSGRKAFQNIIVVRSPGLAPPQGLSPLVHGPRHRVLGPVSQGSGGTGWALVPTRMRGVCGVQSGCHPSLWGPLH